MVDRGWLQRFRIDLSINKYYISLDELNHLCFYLDLMPTHILTFALLSNSLELKHWSCRHVLPEQ